jgi:hypothetical protein
MSKQIAIRLTKYRVIVFSVVAFSPMFLAHLSGY